MKKTILIGVGVIILAVFAYCIWVAARATPCGSGCLGNLSQFAKAIHMYQEDRGELYPNDWQTLADYLASDDYYNATLFVCPSSGHRPGPPNSVNQWCDYVLVTNLTADSQADRIVAYCRSEYERGKRAKAVFVDGSVGMFDAKDFRILLEEQGLEMPQP